jgi:pimeloyl-ACP methyl ester carboxylesterase
MTKLSIISIIVFACFLTSGCTYLQHTFRQAGYESQFEKTQKKSIQKHLLSSETFFVYGKVVDEKKAIRTDQMAIAAMHKTPEGLELVDITHQVRANTYYGLHLPGGDYQIYLLSDLNEDSQYTKAEIIGKISLSLTIDTYPYRVAGDLNIVVARSLAPALADKLHIPVQTTPATEVQQSIFFPKGTIRKLDDPIFSETTATLGMYSPAAFMEKAPMMFYAMEEDFFYKVPVIFVHGIGGSVTQFTSIVEKLDRTKYKPWFFYYPSGANLEKVANLFYQIFLSGELANTDDRNPVIVVAHSMGGVVVRKAINYYKDVPTENKIRLFVSVASPFGGHPDAKMGIEKAPLVLPSWYDMDPDGSFIRSLYSRRLPDFMEHHLIYAYNNSTTVKLGENSDGVVPLSSQLYAPAQKQSTRQYGFDRDHTNILKDDETIATIIQIVEGYKPYLPESHLSYLALGGYNVSLPDTFTAYEQFAIRFLGKYMGALAHGEIQPFDQYEQHFLDVIEGEEKPNLFTESAWLKFKKDFPELSANFQN